ncbi:Bifunctional protein PyrR [Austwickia sp. TVS 96-490-7B]|uniref:bifunctional pyr operon transcriptional regulator/uracil phosphoribosyltransferase PyrR n=1 Tax=Austwickia sp. TVS 96-490-7B TaxID=2830843 RepID=UPI001C598BE8|nr:bifunctional pyr operon transcriptional regulator/uracil phosphoribosyltransferase PyrR [Austwickia sp. TVS 96-490-7B]MBW3086027.1 Bifunctional protein PyrR [Austwickia sp. TVS 96-490-7B]
MVRRDSATTQATDLEGTAVAVPDPIPPDNPPPGSDRLKNTDIADDARVVLGSKDITRGLRRMAHEIVERNKGAHDLVVLGIVSRGAPLARRLAGQLGEVEGADIPVGTLDVTMYRDDLRRQPTRKVEPTVIPPCGIDDKIVVLVDDVLYSGRTIAAALDALGDIGRPRAVRLAVLVDRGHRELPIRADHVGKNLPTSSAERVHVLLAESDGLDEVRISGGDR